jgi:hypothetical protein
MGCGGNDRLLHEQVLVWSGLVWSNVFLYFRDVQMGEMVVCVDVVLAVQKRARGSLTVTCRVEEGHVAPEYITREIGSPQ